MGVVGVKINDNGKILYYKNCGLDLKKNLTIIVDTDKGFQFAKIYSFINNHIDSNKIENGKIIRITTKKDYIQHLTNIKDAKHAVKKCKEIVADNNLDMYIMDAEYTFTRNQLTFRFIADDRIDFRKLAKDLGSYFKTRIELRQIGVRDKAKEIGGVGPCGRRLCCNLFLNEFDSVSINMAKNQSLSLNPSKINGVCGRLLCCLKYENSNYTDCRENLANVGDVIDTSLGKGKIISVDILNRKYKVLTDKEVVIEVEAEDVSKK